MPVAWAVPGRAGVVRARIRPGGPGTLADRRNGVVRPRRNRRMGHRNRGRRAAAAHPTTQTARGSKSFVPKRTFASLPPDTRRCEKSAAGIDAQAEIAYGNNVVFHVQDHWSLTGAVVSVSRKVEVTGNAPGGFDSSVVFTVDPSVELDQRELPGSGRVVWRPHLRWRPLARRHAELRGPALSSCARTSSRRPCSRSPSATALRWPCWILRRAATRPWRRRSSTKAVMTDARFQFGALGAWQADNGPIEFGFRFPGTTSMLRVRHQRAGENAMDSALSPDRAGRGPQLPGEFSLRAERVVPRRDAKLVAMGVEHFEPRRHLH